MLVDLHETIELVIRRLDTPEYISPERIARHLEITITTAKSYIESGELPAQRFGKLIRVRTTDFIKFCESRPNEWPKG